MKRDDFIPKRRRFLVAAASTSIAAFLAPGFAAPRIAFATGRADYRRLLILIELKGGNDGLNTVVPYADQEYYALRPRLAVRRDEVLQLDERTGLHPSLKPLLPLWQGRELAIVQGVGYPQPNLSHFRSIEIWDTASRSDEYLQDGWLARLFSAQPAPAGFAAEGVSVGGADLGPLAGGSARTIALSDPESFLRNGVKTAHIIDGRVSHALLLEVLTSEGVGTLIRGASANRADHR